MTDALFTAIAKSDLDAVKSLLEEDGTLIHTKDKYTGNTPLFESIKSELPVDIPAFLLDRGAEINAKDKYGNTPLHITKDVEVAKLLVERGANIDAKDNYGSTPLHITKDVEVAKLLVERGANIDAKDNYGKTPLFTTESVDIAKLLVERGANIDAKDNYGNTPLFTTESVDIAKLLVESGANIDAKDEYGQTPLFTTKSADIAKLLVESGADINATEVNGNTPLHTVGDVEVARYLVESGANIEAGNTRGETPLFAVYDENVARYLLEKGANIRATNNGGNTLLHEAWNVDRATFLVEHGADIEAQNEDGKTPLRANLDQRIFTVVEYLVENGANIETKDLNGVTPVRALDDVLNGERPDESYDILRKVFATAWTEKYVENRALHIASGRGILFIVEYLVDNGWGVDTPFQGKTALHIAVSNNQKGVVTFLLGKGANINAKDEFGRTHLHLAALYGGVDLIKILLDNGADVHARDGIGRTPLHEAAAEGDIDVVKMLLDNGADIHAKYDAGQTPLHYAIFHIHVVRYLVEKGADIAARSINGDTLLHLAVLEGLVDTIHYLVGVGADVRAENDNGETPLSLAEGRYPDIFAFLTLDDILRAAVLNDTDALNTYLDSDEGRMTSVTDTDGWNALHWAAKTGNGAAVDLLLARNGKPAEYIGLKTNDGQTATILAAKGGHGDVIRSLVGVDPEKPRDDDGAVIFELVQRVFEDDSAPSAESPVLSDLFQPIEQLLKRIRDPNDFESSYGMILARIGTYGLLRDENPDENPDEFKLTDMFDDEYRRRDALKPTPTKEQIEIRNKRREEREEADLERQRKQSRDAVADAAAEESTPTECTCTRINIDRDFTATVEENVTIRGNRLECTDPIFFAPIDETGRCIQIRGMWDKAVSSTARIESIADQKEILLPEDYNEHDVNRTKLYNADAFFTFNEAAIGAQTVLKALGGNMNNGVYPRFVKMGEKEWLLIDLVHTYATKSLAAEEEKEEDPPMPTDGFRQLSL